MFSRRDLVISTKLWSFLLRLFAFPPKFNVFDIYMYTWRKMLHFWNAKWKCVSCPPSHKMYVFYFEFFCESYFVIFSKVCFWHSCVCVCGVKWEIFETCFPRFIVSPPRQNERSIFFSTGSRDFHQSLMFFASTLPFPPKFNVFDIYMYAWSNLVHFWNLKWKCVFRVLIFLPHPQTKCTSFTLNSFVGVVL